MADRATEHPSRALFCGGDTGLVGGSLTTVNARRLAVRVSAACLLALLSAGSGVAFGMPNGAAVRSASTPTPAPRAFGRMFGIVLAARDAAWRPHRPTPADAAGTRFVSVANLAYHNGPVMHTDTTYAIYWQPPGSTVSPNYKTLLNRFFTDVGAASGSTTNVFATDTQYFDTTGPINYSSQFGGSYTDTTPIPDHCSGEYASTGVTVSGCVIDSDIQTAVARALASNPSWTTGRGAEFFVFTPRNVGSCFDSSTGSCAYTYYCAYHSDFFDSHQHDVLYAAQPYPDTSGVGALGACDSGQHPNGDWADPAINLVSHEQNESVTDPDGNAWFDSSGNENGDKCAWNFGSPLGATFNGSYNQVINGDFYYLQQEWSNATGSCVQRMSSSGPPPANDFSIGASPSGLTLAQGASGTSTISTAVAGGSAGTVSLAVSGVPAGATAAVSPTSVTAGNASTLTVHAGTAAAGPYTITVTGTEGSATHATSVTLTVTAVSGGGVLNGGFETGSLSGWTASGASATVVSGGCHGGTFCARLGSTTATNGDSSIAQTFTVPSGASTVSFWYRVTCPDTVTFDWAVATLRDNTAGTTATVLPHTCTNSGAWVQISSSVIGGHSYTLTLTSHDDNYPGDPTYTLFDDVTIGTAPPPPPPANDFSIGASPSGLTLAQGASGTSTISTAVAGGSAGTVSLAVSGVPAGATAAVSPTSVTAGNASTLTVHAGTAAAGPYTITVTGTEGSATHATSVTLTVTAVSGGGVLNGGFETGSLSGWTASGASATVVSGGCHGGTFCARLGSTTATNGDSSIAQTFTVPSGASTVSFWYRVTCPDTVTFDWAVATLRDNTAGTTATVLPHTCTNSGAWVQISSSVIGGHSYTLTLTSHDDNYPGDPTYTLFDDVTIQ